MCSKAAGPSPAPSGLPGLPDPSLRPSAASGERRGSDFLLTGFAFCISSDETRSGVEETQNDSDLKRRGLFLPRTCTSGCKRFGVGVATRLSGTQVLRATSFRQVWLPLTSSSRDLRQLLQLQPSHLHSGQEKKGPWPLSFKEGTLDAVALGVDLAAPARRARERDRGQQALGTALRVGWGALLPEPLPGPPCEQKYNFFCCRAITEGGGVCSGRHWPLYVPSCQPSPVRHLSPPRP